MAAVFLHLLALGIADLAVLLAVEIEAAHHVRGVAFHVVRAVAVTVAHAGAGDGQGGEGGGEQQGGEGLAHDRFLSRGRRGAG